MSTSLLSGRFATLLELIATLDTVKCVDHTEKAPDDVHPMPTDVIRNGGVATAHVRSNDAPGGETGNNACVALDPKQVNKTEESELEGFVRLQ